MSEAILPSLLLGASVGGAAGYLGSLMISRRMALVGDALGHVALPGMGLALALGADSSLGAVLSLAAGVLLIWALERWTSLALETLVGIVFVSSLALGFIIIPNPELLETLIGDISKISGAALVLAIAASVVVSVVVRRIYPGMTLLNLSPDLAAVEGVSVQAYNFLYLAAVALIVAVGVRVTGSLLVGALVVVPAATARILSIRLNQYAVGSASLGALSSVVGIVVSHYVHFPTGPAIILVSAVLFGIAVGLRK